MADLHKTTKSTIYPMRVHRVTAHRRTVAARGLQLHALGSWTRADGAAARQRLRQRLRPLRPRNDHHRRIGRARAASPSTGEVNAARSARMEVPPLAGVVLVDGRWVSRPRTRRAPPLSTRSQCADCHERRAVHAMSVDMSGDAQGWARRVRVPRPDCGIEASLFRPLSCPTSSGRASAARS